MPPFTAVLRLKHNYWEVPNAERHCQNRDSKQRSMGSKWMLPVGMWQKYFAGTTLFQNIVVWDPEVQVSFSMASHHWQGRLLCKYIIMMKIMASTSSPKKHAQSLWMAKAAGCCGPTEIISERCSTFMSPGGWSCTSGCDPRTPEMTGERGGHCGTDRAGTRGRGEQKGAGSVATSDVANQVAAVGRDQSLTSERRGSRRAWLWEPPCLPFLSLETFFFFSLFLRLGRSREGLCIFRHKKKKKNPQNFHFEKADVVPCVPLPPQELIPQTAVELWSGRSWSGAFPGTAGIKIPVA